MRADSDSERDDEVMEVKRAMVGDYTLCNYLITRIVSNCNEISQREARARKKSLESKLKGQLSRDANERSELELIIRSLREELDSTKSELSSTKYDLKESKFEINQLKAKCTKLNEERKLLESVHRTQQLELQLKMETSTKKNDEKYHLISIESEKIARLADKLLKDVSSSSSKSQVLRTHQHLLEKLVFGISRVKDINLGANSSPSMDLQASLIIAEVYYTTLFELSFLVRNF